MARAQIDRRVVYRTAGTYCKIHRGQERSFNVDQFVIVHPLKLETRARSLITIRTKNGSTRSLWALDSAESIREAVKRAKNGGKG